jgi:hypothetical protein
VSRASKFAPMTSNLLARKGEAGPSVGPGKANPGWHDWREMAPRAGSAFAALSALPEYVRPVEQPAPAQPAPGHPPGVDSDHPRKIIIKLSQEEHERLAIAAVKKGVTRNQLVRAALDAYADALLQEYGKTCACIAGSCGKRCES